MLYLLFCLFVLIFCYLLYRHQNWQPEPWPKNALQVPPYQAHRGYWQKEVPENTLDAFALAQTQGYQMFELDVRLTLDGVPVVFHDADLLRMAGVQKPVHELLLKDLQVLFAAPTLEQVLLNSQRPPFVNIELKTTHILDGSLEKAVAEVVRKTKTETTVLFSSFNPITLWRLRLNLPNVPRALLATRERAHWNAVYLRDLWFVPYIGVHILHLDHRYWTPQDVVVFKKRKIPVALWTVNEKEKAQAYLQAGALSIISDTLREH